MTINQRLRARHRCVVRRPLLDPERDDARALWVDEVLALGVTQGVGREEDDVISRAEGDVGGSHMTLPLGIHGFKLLGRHGIGTHEGTDA